MDSTSKTNLTTKVVNTRIATNKEKQYREVMSKKTRRRHTQNNGVCFYKMGNPSG